MMTSHSDFPAGAGEDMVLLVCETRRGLMMLVFRGRAREVYLRRVEDIEIEWKKKVPGGGKDYVYSVL